MPEKQEKIKPWYAGENQDALFYLLIAIFFIELIVGGVAFFYGIIHAAPETPGGPPVARFPWLAWGIAAVLAPVALLLITHLAGSWLSRALTREEVNAAQTGGSDSEHVPEGMKRFYASVRHAPTVVILVAILCLGGALFFIEGAFGALMDISSALIPYIPWLAGSIGGLLAICFLVHAIMVYRQRKMEQEYAWRREVLEKTGMVLVDKASIALPQNAEQAARLALGPHSGQILDVTEAALPPGEETDGKGGDKNT